MNELQKLYDVLVREGKYTKSFEDFQQKWSQDQAYKDKVYEVVSRDGLYTKDKNSFLQKYSVSGQPTDQILFTEGAKKKGDTTALPSEDGSLVSSESADPEALRFAELVEKQGQFAGAKTNAYQPKIDPKLKEFFAKVKEDDRLLEIEKKKAEDLFDRQTLKPQIDQSVYLKERLSTINKDLINREEEYVVPEMQYQFGDLGFKFEEAGATGDWMNVTAPNGQKLQISLDNFLDSKSEAESNKLQKFIKDNTSQRGLFVLEQTMREQDKKFNSQKQVDDETSKLNNEATLLNQSQKNFLLNKSAYEADIAELIKTPANQRNTPEFNRKAQELEKRRAELSQEVQTILNQEEVIKKRGIALEASIGKYTIAKSKQGT
jgi:hypothetical protein